MMRIIFLVMFLSPLSFADYSSNDDVKIFIDPAAIMFLLGSTMDFKSDKFKSGFVFMNPNETERCGCGESFSV